MVPRCSGFTIGHVGGIMVHDHSNQGFGDNAPLACMV
jgi:hypothetical protein